MAHDLTAYIKSHSRKILGAKFLDVRLICRTDSGFKQEKLEPRYLVVSKFRIFFISAKTAQKIQVESNFHILSIVGIEVVSAKEVRLTLEDSRKILVHVHELEATEVAKSLLRAFKHYFPSCNDSLKLFLNLQPTSLYVDYISFASSKPTLPCENFRRSYAALCDYYKLPFRDEVVWDIEKIYACHQNKSLRVEDFNHLLQRDLVPIIGVLQFSQWFTSLIIENIKVVGDLLDVICLVLKRSQWLRALTLSNCSLKSDVIVTFQNCLTSNPSLPLECLNLSRNSFEEHKPFIALGNSLVQLNSRFKEIRLSECSLNVKAVNGIAGGIFRSQLNGPCLTVLDLSSNPLKDDISEVCTLLSHCTTLQDLDLSNTNICIEKLWVALKIGGLQLRVLKLSGCIYASKKMSIRQNGMASVPPSIKEFFASAMALKTLDLSNCTLPPEVVKCILLGLACNQDLTELAVDLSRSCIDASVSAVLETALPSCAAISSLSLRDNCLYESLTSLLPAIGRMPSLMVLDIGGNNLHSPRKHHMQMLPSILIELVKIISDDESSIRELILTDGSLGVHMSVIFNALGVAPHLYILDVSGNNVGNFGARLLAKALQINTSLHTLHIDRNQINFEGYSDILNALNDNKKVAYMSYPVHDVVEATSKGDKDKTVSVLAKIEILLSRNRSSSKFMKGESEKRAHKARQLDEELNTQLYECQKIADDADTDQTGQESVKLRLLIEDAENTKKLSLSQVTPSIASENVDKIVESFVDAARPIIQTQLQKCVQDAIRERQSLNVVENSADLNDSLMELSNQINFSFDNLIVDLKSKIQDVFSDTYDLSMYSMSEKLNTALISELKSCASQLNRMRAASQSSVHSLSSLPSQSPVTPKSKKKSSFFSHRNKGRPKSTIDPEALDLALKEHNANASGDDVFDDEGGNSSIDSSSLGFETARSTDFTESVEGERNCGEERLVCVAKTRPRGPVRRPPQSKVPAIEHEKHAFKVDQLFAPSVHKTGDVIEEVAQETSENHELKIDVNSKEEKRKQPTPGGLGALGITPNMLKLKKPTVVDDSPSAPPNTPATPLNVGKQTNLSSKPATDNVLINDKPLALCCLKANPDYESVEKHETVPVAVVDDKKVVDYIGTKKTGAPALVKEAPPRPPLYKSVQSDKLKMGSADENGNTSSGDSSTSQTKPLKPPLLPPKPEHPPFNVKLRSTVNSASRPFTSIYLDGKGEGDKLRDERKSVMDLIGTYDLQKPVPPPRAKNFNKVSPVQD